MGRELFFSTNKWDDDVDCLMMLLLLLLLVCVGVYHRLLFVLPTYVRYFVVCCLTDVLGLGDR